MKTALKIFAAILLLTGVNNFAPAQKTPEKNWNSARIAEELQKMKHVGRVLYVAAHPDDENTQLISYLSNVMGLETSYLSLTRGDGGQNLLGPQVRGELGVIRTQELLMARSVDGGQQFFTRANDFGFSKTAAETLHIWDSNEVLSDMVWVIRELKPDIIITRFSPTYAKTHGHHQASAILAMAAFKDAADPSKFPEQLKYVDTWQARSLFWNTSPWFYAENKMDTSGLCHTNIGVYMPLLGKSTGEMAAESRSMHKSQGMGTAPKRGDMVEYFKLLEGKKPSGRNIFSVADFDWNRIKGCEDISAEVETIIRNFDMLSPEKSVNALVALHNKLEPLKKNYLVQAKLSQIENVILKCLGIYTEAISAKEFLAVGDSAHLTLDVFNPSSSHEIGVSGALMLDGDTVSTLTNADSSLDKPGTLIPASKNRYGLTSRITDDEYIKIPDTTKISGPYWLEEEPTVGMYRVSEQLLRGLPYNPAQLYFHLNYAVTYFDKNSLKGKTLNIGKNLPVFFKTVDPLKGEVYSPARIVPPAVATPGAELMVFTNSNMKMLTIKVKSFVKEPATLHIKAPDAWTIDSLPSHVRHDYYLNFDMQGDGSEETFSVPVCIRDWKNAAPANLYVTIAVNGHSYNRAWEEIDYEHIPKQVLLPKSRVKLEKIDIKTSNKLIGYINGAGDDIPQCLKEIGYKVETISPAQLSTINLNKYHTIIAGVRAYNTVPGLKYDNRRLLNFVKNGGTYIVQYNNHMRLVTDSIGPYYLHLSTTRTTEEDCKVTFLNTDNPVLNTPNKLTQKDFEGWVQERGLYYPDKWDTTHYVPVLEMADKGEKPTQGALLIAKYGEGYFVYTGLVFFRELPAGVPGAFRLMANLIELGIPGGNKEH